MSIIRKFLNDLKENPEIGDIGSQDYPIQFKDPDHVLRSGYITGAREWYDGSQYNLEVYMMAEDYEHAFEFYNHCVAPAGCEHINWDSLHCATEIKSQN